MDTMILSAAVDLLLSGDLRDAQALIVEHDPFVPAKVRGRKYSETEKMQVFLRDGFIDRYSGKQLVNPGVLKSITCFFPEAFPYHPHWKTTQCHRAYWELLPTIDHIVPIAHGGDDVFENWVTTSMLNNSIKSNWTLEELRWGICPAGDLAKWDGLTKKFISLAETTPGTLSDPYIRRWYNISKKLIGGIG